MKKLEKEIEDISQMNQTIQIVRYAMEVVSPYVREPKVVRDGIVRRAEKQYD